MNPLRFVAAVSAVLLSTFVIGSDARATCVGTGFGVVQSLCEAGTLCDTEGCRPLLADLFLGHVVSERPDLVEVDEVLRSDGSPALAVGDTFPLSGAGTVDTELVVVLRPDDLVPSAAHLVQAEGIRFGDDWMDLDTVRAYAAAAPPCESIPYTELPCDDTGEGVAWSCAGGPSAAGGAGVLLLAMAWMVARTRRRRRT